MGVGTGIWSLSDVVDPPAPGAQSNRRLSVRVHAGQVYQTLNHNMASWCAVHRALRQGEVQLRLLLDGDRQRHGPRWLGHQSSCAGRAGACHVSKWHVGRG